MKTVLLFFLFLFSVKVFCQPTDSNFEQSVDAVFVPIFRNQRWGFIDTSGEEVIAPKFHEVKYFIESLAAARTDGAWGFIDRTGNYVIPPMYDLAGDFSNGQAVVWKDGVPSFIDAKGACAFELQGGIYAMRNWGEDRQVFTFIRPESKESRYFVLRFNGEIDPFESLLKPAISISILTRTVEHIIQYALQDSNGNVIVPFGTYNHIHPFQHGFAEVRVPAKGAQDSIGIINEKGHLMLALPPGIGLKNVENSGFSDRLAIVDLNWSDERIIPLVSDFLSCYHDSLRRLQLTGEQICQMSKLMEVRFYSIIDANGRHISEKFNDVHPKGFQQEGLLVQIWETPRKEHFAPTFKPLKQQWGLLNRLGKWVIPPIFTHVGPEGFRNGLLYVETDSVCGYINAKGKFIWRTQKERLLWEPKKLNVDFMLPASYYAYSGRKRISSDTSSKEYTGNKVGIVIKPDEPILFKSKYKGLTAYLYNSGLDTLPVDVQDGQLYMVLQALDATGEWRDIEYVPSSWCGNSYYQRFMPPNEYWTFEIPAYDGDFSTSLRLAFSLENKFDTVHRIYSNSIPGKINRIQFWRRKRGLFSLDICED